MPEMQFSVDPAFLSADARILLEVQKNGSHRFLQKNAGKLVNCCRLSLQKKAVFCMNEFIPLGLPPH